MINIKNQSKKLKLNVTKIKSSLFSFNKKLKKVRLDKERFDSQETKRLSLFKKESSIESSVKKVTSPLKKASSAILSGPKNIFDKIIEFLGTILLGLLINNLQLIISKLKKFFGNNPWILKSIKFTIDVIGKGLNSIIWAITNFSKLAGGTYDVIKFARDNIKVEIDKLARLYDGVENGIDTLSKSWYSFFNPTRPQSSGPIPPSSPSQSPSRTQQSPPPLSTPQAPFTLPSTATPSQQNPYGYAKGGTVSQARKVSAGTNVQSTTKTTSPFAKPGGTAKGKKANQAVNYFEFFRKNTKVDEDNARMSEENNNKFKEVLKKFNELKTIRKKVGDEASDGGGGGGGGGVGGGGNFTGTAADIPPEGKALLDAISGAEAPGYNSRYPSKTFSNGYKDHPRIPEPTPDGRTSDAAGRYQFLSSTWDSYKPAKAFTPENQDIAAWKLATATYGYGEAGIVKDLQKDPMKVADKLKGQWPSLPGGSQPNNATSGFLSRYKDALKRYKELTTKPTVGAFRNVLPQGNPQFSSGFQTNDRPGHNGIDIGVDVNAPVVALQSGKVVNFYNSFGGVGNAIVVEHSDKTKLIYGHVVASGGLKVGDPVQKGQVIAKVVYYRGPRGEDYTHLHLERVVGGRWVNPIPFLNSVESSRREDLKQNDPRRKIEPGKQGPVLPTTTTQSVMAPTPSVPFGKVFTFTARDSKKYRVEFGKFFEGQFGIIPVDTSKTNNKWLIDDYNKAVERYQINQQSNVKPSSNSGGEGSNAASSISPKFKNSDISSVAPSNKRDTVYINSVQPYIINNTEIVAYADKQRSNLSSSNSTSNKFFSQALDILES